MTERHRAEEETRQAKERISVILASITEGCFSIDRQWRFTYINPQGARWLMHAPEDLLGKPLLEVFPEAVGSVFHETYQRTMEQQAFAECEAFYAPLGAWFNARAYPSPEGVTVFFLDISERKRNEQRLLHAATHDALTGLTNRASCIGTLEELLQEARAAGRKLGVLFIDLDRFKEINDAFSHRVGDKALACIGRRLCEQADAARLPARISGDAFLFILPDTDERSATAFAFSVIETIGKPMRIEQAEISVGASIGIAISDNEPLSPDELINRADSAMYRAKAAGRHTAVMYSPGIALWEKRRHQLRRELSAALRAGQFELFYQPQYLLADGQVTGAEALIRWRHPQYGLLAPDAFLQLAEESALILEVGAWVIDEACRQAAQWKREGHALKMSVNVSTRQLNDSNLPALLTQYSAKHGLDPSAIKIEITESMLAQDFDTAAEVLSALKEKGFRIALDDFGTGYSNLAYINRFPINAIKIDRSFVRNLATDSAALRLVNGIVALAKSLDLTVIVEGVETEEQRTALRTTPCDTIQGYLTGRPVPAQEFYTQHLRRQG
jgi:diguanylate cyclase (GGDEF)-like protein/PAS domain S-box-containing protein